MAYISAEEVRQENIDHMGKELGEQYSLVWQETASLHEKWAEYIELFGSRPSRIDLLNDAAPHFFGIIQNEMWEDILLHLARLTDKSEVGKKQNLTLQNLPALIADDGLKTRVSQRIDDVLDETKFCRDWRNRVIAHQDLDIAMERAAELLLEGSRADVTAALAAVVAVLNEVSTAYHNAEAGFGALSPPGGALDLLHVLHDGIRARREREERFEQNIITAADIEVREI